VKSLCIKLLFQWDEFAEKLAVLADRDRERLELIVDMFKREDIENRYPRELEEVEMAEVQPEEVDRVPEAMPRLRAVPIPQKRVEDAVHRRFRCNKRGKVGA
jgi:hypothetical protein